MKRKVTELEGALLDAAVATAEGRIYDYLRMGTHGVDFITVANDEKGWTDWSPSRRWADGGEIVERERIAITPLSDCWEAWHVGHLFYGESPLVAAMRAFVIARFGDELELPDLPKDR